MRCFSLGCSGGDIIDDDMGWCCGQFSVAAAFSFPFFLSLQALPDMKAQSLNDAWKSVPVEISVIT